MKMRDKKIIVLEVGKSTADIFYTSAIVLILFSFS